MRKAAGRQEPPPRDDPDDGEVSVERLGVAAGARLRHRTWRGRGHVQSGDRRRRLEARDGALEAADPGARAGDANRDRTRDCVESGRRDDDQGGGPAQADVRGAQGQERQVSVQTDPRHYRDPDAIVAQAEHFAARPQHHGQIPVTAAGVPAIEEATERGISINATVCFSLPQCSRSPRQSSAACAAASGRAGHLAMGPVCTIMVGRLDDWLKVVADSRNERGSRRARMGRRGGVQEDLPPVPGAAVPIPAAVGRLPEPHALERADRRRRRDLAAARVAEALQQIRDRRRAPHRPAGRAGDPAALERFADYRRASTETASPSKSSIISADRRTLRQFIAACHELDGQIVSMLPNPDITS